VPKTEERNAYWWRVFKFFAQLSGMLIIVLTIAMWMPYSAVKATFDQTVLHHISSGKDTSAPSIPAPKSVQSSTDEISKLEREVEAQGAIFSAEKMSSTI